MKKKVLLLTFLLSFGMSMATGCSKDEVKIESRSDDSVTERNSAITYDVDGTEDAAESDVSDHTDSETENETGKGLEEGETQDGFIFSADPDDGDTVDDE